MIRVRHKILGNQALIVCAMVMLMLCGASVTAQPSSGTLYLKILDSSTGGGIAPGKITVDKSPVKFQVEAGSLIAMPLSAGSHSITVEAEGYTAMEFSAAVTGADTPITTIELDPVNIPEPEPVAPDAAVVEGNVSDADTGVLLSGVTVTIPDTQLTTITDESGRYNFEIIVGATGEKSQPAIVMEVRAEGYTPRRLKNITLVAGERRHMPIKLDRATSATDSLEIVETDENTRPGFSRTSDWTYDVTIR